jgi:hypothetical protein
MLGPAEPPMRDVSMARDRLSSGDGFVSLGHPDMDRDAELEIVRRAYAKHIMASLGLSDRRIEAAFAAVKREHFLSGVDTRRLLESIPTLDLLGCVSLDFLNGSVLWAVEFQDRDHLDFWQYLNLPEFPIHCPTTNPNLIV